MPNCPKCESSYPNGSLKCQECGEPLDDLKEPAQHTKASAKSVDLVAAGRIAIRYWPMIIAGGLFLAMYWDFFAYLVDQWGVKQSYYSHGPLVPAIALFMIWSNRKRMATIKVEASWLGLLLILPCVPIFMFGRWTGSSALVSFTFLPVMVGAMLMLTGPRMTRLLLFPILFLFFMIPLPSTLLDSATFKVQMQSTTLAAKILGLTYDVTQHGAIIESGDLPEPLVVGTPCSGFRLLISLLTFTAFFVYMVQTTAWKKALMVLLAFPLSLFINSLRITMIGYAGIWTGSADAMHKFHDWSGYLNLVICFAILFGFARILKADKFGLPDPAVSIPSEQSASKAGIWCGMRRLGLLLTLALLVVSNIMIPPLKLSAKGKLNRSAIPTTFGHWTSNEIPVDETVREVLKTGDMTQRVYVDSTTGRQIMVFIEAARDANAFHDPHSCLPGGGSPITQDKLLRIKIDKPRPMTINATMLQATSTYGSSIVVYWYMHNAETYPTTPAMRRAMRKAQLNDFQEIVFHPGSVETVTKRTYDNQWYWYRFSTEIWQDAQTDLKDLSAFIRQLVMRVEGFGE